MRLNISSTDCYYCLLTHTVSLIKTQLQLNEFCKFMFYVNMMLSLMLLERNGWSILFKNKSCAESTVNHSALDIH